MSALARLVARIVRVAGENPPHERLEGGELLGRVVGIEGALIPGRAEVHAGLVPGMIAVALAGVAIAPEVMHVVVVLEQAVVLHDPRRSEEHTSELQSRELISYAV